MRTEFVRQNRRENDVVSSKIQDRSNAGNVSQVRQKQNEQICARPILRPLQALSQPVRTVYKHFYGLDCHSS
jgi:hypothetical protein